MNPAQKHDEARALALEINGQACELMEIIEGTGSYAQQGNDLDRLAHLMIADLEALKVKAYEMRQGGAL